MMNAHRITRTLGTAAAAFLAAGLISLATSAVARADDEGSLFSLNPDTDLMVGPMQNFGLFSDISFADPDDSEFVGTIFAGPEVNGSPLFTDILTSGNDPSGVFQIADLIPNGGLGVAGETVNTLFVPGIPALTFSLPFTDPLAQLFTELLPLGF